jgi:hypothetical protein
MLKGAARVDASMLGMLQWVSFPELCQLGDEVLLYLWFIFGPVPFVLELTGEENGEETLAHPAKNLKRVGSRLQPRILIDATDERAEILCIARSTDCS